MKTSVVIGVVAVLAGLFSVMFYDEPSGALAVIAGMFPFVLIRS